MKGVRCCPHLHEDLVIDILLRLPVKSLLRFKSVCQAWRAIISCPSFIQKHFLRDSNCTSLLAYWSGDKFSMEKYRECGDFYDKFYELSLFRGENLVRCEDADHKELPGQLFRMHGPCKGIFCVLHSGGAMALWNPATRSLFEVPHCPLHGYTRRVFAFGMDPLTGDTKVVVISGIGKIQKFAVYSLSNNSWRLLEQTFDQADVPISVVSYDSAPAFSDGYCYWLKRHEDTSHFVILAFDLHNELFREIEMPEVNLEASVIGEAQLDWYNGSLALLTRHNLADETRVAVWSMKEEDCWTKIRNFALPFGKVTYVGVWMRNQFFAVTSDRELLIYDIDAHNTSNVEYCRVEDASDHKRLFAFSYKESLYSFEGVDNQE